MEEVNDPSETDASETDAGETDAGEVVVARRRPTKRQLFIGAAALALLLGAISLLGGSDEAPSDVELATSGTTAASADGSERSGGTTTDTAAGASTTTVAPDGTTSTTADGATTVAARDATTPAGSSSNATGGGGGSNTGGSGSNGGLSPAPGASPPPAGVSPSPSPSPPPASPTPPPPPPPPPAPPAATAPAPRVAIYGDSGALGLGVYSGGYTDSPDRLLDKVKGITPLGCGVLMTSSAHGCKTAAEWASQAVASSTQIALVYSGAWETRCLKPSDENWDPCRTIGDPVFDEYVRRHLRERSTALLNAGVEYVVYVKQEFGPGAKPEDLAHPERWTRWYQLLDEHAATNSRIRVIDARPWFQSLPNPTAIRYDGYHYTDQAFIVWRDYLESELYWKLWLPAKG